MQKYLTALNHTVTEVRILRSDRYLVLNGRREYTGETVSGYYIRDAYDKLESDIQPFDKSPSTTGIYTTLHACDPALLARAENRLNLNAKNTTSDHEIVAFTCLPIDVDPERPTGISSSAEDLRIAAALAKPIADFLTALDIPFFKGMSGNGCHLGIQMDPAGMYYRKRRGV